MSAGASRAQAPDAMQRATTPVTCGAAKLVPEPLPSVLLVFASPQVDAVQTPGAATVWAASVESVAKLLKPAGASSGCEAMHGDTGPVPPGIPSVSPIAVTVKTSSYAAGTCVCMSTLSF